MGRGRKYLWPRLLYFATATAQRKTGTHCLGRHGLSYYALLLNWKSGDASAEEVVDVHDTDWFFAVDHE